MKSQEFIFASCFPCLWGCVLKEVTVADVKELTAYVLLYDFDWVLSHIEVFHPFWVYLWVRCKRMVQFHSSAHGCPIFPALFVEDTVFSFHWIVFPPLSKISWQSWRSFLGSLFSSTDLCVCFCANTNLSWGSQLYNIAWSQAFWCLQLWFSISTFPWQFRVFSGSIQILGFFVPALWKMSMIFW